MDKFKTVEVTILSNGTVRVYGDAGMIFEVRGEYVRTTTTIDPQPEQLSGEMKVQK